MAICWRCPDCGHVSCETEVESQGKALACDRCERPSIPENTQCIVCDAPNPWARRDSVHYFCRSCGHVQTYYSHTQIA
jgi:RNase P subunit RPR2